MSHEAAEAFAKATHLLERANSADPESFPEMVVHTAYYAMYHAARACLLTRNRNVTTRHERLASALQRAADGPGVAEASRLLRKVYRLRAQVDYEAAFRPDRELASRVLEAANRFFDLCRAEFGLDAAVAAAEEERRRPSS